MTKKKETNRKTDEEIMNAKLNTAGKIITRQIKKIESARRNAIRSNNQFTYNEVIAYFSNRFAEMEINENETATDDKEFDISNIINSPEE